MRVIAAYSTFFEPHNALRSAVTFLQLQIIFNPSGKMIFLNYGFRAIGPILR
jgi:hypothetical protein